MILAEVPMLGPYSVTVNSSTSTAPGAPDALSDHSEATYVDVDQYIGPSGVFLNNVTGTLGTGGTSVAPSPLVAVYARFIGGPIANVRLVVGGTGGSSGMDPSGVPIESPLGTLYPMDANGLGVVNDAINGFSVTMYVDVPADRENHIISRIYEAWMVIRLLSSDAPPCRIFPRGDGLGVGAGRAFPPPKSQQRSPGNRGVGYY